MATALQQELEYGTQVEVNLPDAGWVRASYRRPANFEDGGHVVAIVKRKGKFKAGYLQAVSDDDLRRGWF